MCLDITYTQSDITFSTHLWRWFRTGYPVVYMTSTMHRWIDDDVAVCSQSLICWSRVIFGKNLHAKNLHVKYVFERAFDSEVSSCKTTNSCKESVKICDDGGSTAKFCVYNIDMNRRAIEN